MIPFEYQKRLSAPYFAGLFSLEAVSERPDAPDVTVYHTEVRAAEAWKNELMLRGDFKKLGRTLKQYLYCYRT